MRTITCTPETLVIALGYLTKSVQYEEGGEGWHYGMELNFSFNCAALTSVSTLHVAHISYT